MLNIALNPGFITAATGNVLVPYDLPATGTNVRLGGFEDGSTGTAVSLLYNSLGAHRLIRYDPVANTETTLLEWAGLNLAAALVVQGGIFDGLLVYLAADGMLRNVPLARAATGFYTPDLLAAEPYALHLVKVPPTTSAPTATRTPATGDDRDSLRIIEINAYQFATRWRYADGETTPLSPFSNWVDVTDNPATTTLRSITVNLPPAPSGVSEVEVLVRQAGATAWVVADTLRRNLVGVLPTQFAFYGVVSGAALTVADATRPFESEWPGKAAGPAQSRIFKGDLTEGYVTPEPAFTATVLSANAATTRTVSVYDLAYLLKNQFIGHRYYVLATGSYPGSDSTYYQATATGAPNGWTLGTVANPYSSVFERLLPGEADPPLRTISTLDGQSVTTPLSTVLTLHENSSYRVACQFYDAQGKPGGASQAQALNVPGQNYAGLQQRSIALTLTTGISGQDAEIPAWAYSYQFLVARNSRAVEFRQGQAADIRAFLGRERIVNVDGTTKEIPTLAVKTTAHEKLWVDIGNWPAAGLGYVWNNASGDLLRFMEDGRVFPITGQEGDYVEVQWSGAPIADFPRVEIYAPATVSANTFYERGPRLPVVRLGTTRRYSQTNVRLEGDCFLTPLSFPQLDTTTSTTSGTYSYNPPEKKRYLPATQPLMVESMVPQYRLSLGTIKTTTTQAFDSIIPASLDNPIVRALVAKAALEQRTNILNPQNIVLGDAFAAQVGGPASAVWLDMSYGGRPGLAVPLALQQVRRKALIRFCGVKVVGTLLNGLSQWDALSQYDEIPQEQGAITRLTVADQTQTDGSILLVNQERGAVSLSLGQSQIRTADDQPLLAITKSVIGGGNALRGGYGCTDPAGVVAYAGKVFFPCRQRAELLRYDRNGLTPLALTYKVRARLEAAFRLYASARITGCFDPRRKEYLLVFGATDTLPGLTLVYSDRYEAWSDELSMRPEAGLGLGNELISYQGGAAWRHTPDAPQATFYGTYTAPQIAFTVAQPAGVAKQFKDVAIESASLWLPTQLKTDTKLVSRTLPPWFTLREGVYRAGLRRAENTAGFPSVYASLDNGRPLIGMRLTLTLTAPANAAPLTAVSVSQTPRSGQNMSA